MRVLFDTETTSTIISQKFTAIMYINQSKKHSNGIHQKACFTLKEIVNNKFKLLEIDTHKEIS